MKRINRVLFFVFITTLFAFLTFTVKQEFYFSTKTKREQLEIEKWRKVIKIIDGDTIDVDINGKIERVRLIGIDTPEIKDPRKKIECFGYEASLKTEDFLKGKTVRLEPDETQSDRDKYGRLLRYVYSDNQTFINEELIKSGYAYEYTYDVPYKYMNQFKEMEKQARINEIGLWNPDKCNGKR